MAFLFFYHQKTKNTNERNVKKNKGKESEEEEEGKNNDYYIKQRDEPPGTSKHLQKKAKKQAKKQAKVGFDKYFIFTKKHLKLGVKQVCFFCFLSLRGRRGENLEFQFRINQMHNKKDQLYVGHCCEEMIHSVKSCCTRNKLISRGM